MTRSRTAALVAGVLVLGGGTAAATGALAGSPSVPPAKPLATAVHDAITAPAVQGIQARVTFTNKLIDSSSLVGGSPLLSGAKGRLWLAQDGRARLELQSERGDAQITSDGKTVTVFDASSNQAYVVTLPPEPADSKGADPKTPPSFTRVKKALDRLMQAAAVTGPTGTNIAGREAYSVRIGPKHDGGLLGAGELAWDAANGVPLRAGIYAADSKEPVLELAATGISYGPVADSALNVPPPQGAKVTKLDLGAKEMGKDGKPGEQITGVDAVSAKLPFTLAAPDELVGLPRHQVRLVRMGEGGEPAALVTYGKQLGGIAVLQQAVKPKDAAPAKGDPQGLQLPKISIDGVDGQELATALGTLVRFERGGVAYTVIGSVPPAAAEAAARGL